MGKRKTMSSNNLSLKKVEALTECQAHVLMSDKNLVLYGLAGTGKTYLAMYIGLKDVMSERYDNVVVIRSAVPTREIGFLPGTETEKTAVYEEPYIEAAISLLGRGDGYSVLKQKGFLEFKTTSHLRGITMDNSVIIVDECQNMTFHELDSIMTRAGEYSKVIFCGDFNQSDLNNNGRGREKFGMPEFLPIIKKLDEFDMFEFELEDIVRSGLVKSYLIAKSKMLE